MNRPSPGSMVWWRFTRRAPCSWSFGYATYAQGADLIRMGCYNGDISGGTIVSANEIEWKEYTR